MIERVLAAAAALLSAWGAPHAPHAPTGTPKHHHTNPMTLSGVRPGRMPVASYGGVVAWWEGGRLMAWRGRAVRRVAVRPLGPGGAEDLDLGPGPNGHVWAVFTRCDDFCRPVGFDLDAGVEHDLGLRAGRRAAIWRDRIAYVTGGRGAAPPRLAIANVGGAGRPRRMPIVAPWDEGEGMEGGDGPPYAITDVDLRGPRIAYVLESADGRDQVLRAGRIDVGRFLPDRAGGIDGEECTSWIWSPQLGAHGITWLQELAGDVSTCGDGPSYLRRRRWGAARDERSPLPRNGPVAAFAARGRVVVEGPPPGAAHRTLRDPCVLAGDGDHAGCEIRALRAPRWRPAPPG